MPDRIPLIGGSYYARSPIANAQRCINLYPELNRQDSPVPFTLYQRPGLRPLAQIAGGGAVRGLYQASNGVGYAAIGQSIYAIDAGWGLAEIGALTIPGSAPVSFIDNGTTMMIVDSTSLGYSVDLSSNAFATIADPTGTFNGATRVDYIDTFMLWNLPGTREFGSTLSNELTFDALYVAGKSGYPDPLRTLIVNKREIILLGALKSEIWYDAGNTGFPFAELPGAYIEHGIAAPYSVASNDIQVFWLGRDLQGTAIVYSLRGYDTRRVSNHALETAMESMPTVTDAIGYAYQQGGHVFYVLTFPSANQTWAYDVSLESDPTMAWHQRAWTDSDGNLNRHRGMSSAFINETNVVGDWQNGTIYAQDPNYFVDTVGGVDCPLSCVKGFPHVADGTAATRQGRVASGGNAMQFGKFIADIECGNAPLAVDGSPAQIGLAYSIDRGRTFLQEVLQSNGAPGEFWAQPQFPTGVLARDVVFELRHAIAGRAALNGAWAERVVTQA